MSDEKEVKQEAKQEKKVRRYGMPLSKKDVETLGCNPEDSTADIHKAIREKMGLPVVKTEREEMLDKLGLPKTASAKEIRKAVLAKI